MPPCSIRPGPLVTPQVHSHPRMASSCSGCTHHHALPSAYMPFNTLPSMAVRAAARSSSCPGQGGQWRLGSDRCPADQPILAAASSGAVAAVANAYASAAGSGKHDSQLTTPVDPLWQELLQRVLQHSAEGLKHTAQAGGWRSFHAGSSGGDSADDRVSSHDTASTSSSGTAPLHASSGQPQRTQQLLPVRKWVMLLQGLLAVRPHSASSHASVSGHTKVQSATQVAPPADQPSTVLIDNGALPQMDSANWVTAVDAVIAAMHADTSARRLRAAEIDVLVQLLAAAGELLHHRSQQRRQSSSQGAGSAAGVHAQEQESGLAGLVLTESWAALQNSSQVQWREQVKAQERWLQVVLSALRPHLPQLSSKQLLCVLRALGRGTGRTDNQPYKPHPQWVQALFQAMQAPRSPSAEALPAGARKQTAAATATATSSTGGSAVPGLQAAGSSMEAMDGPQLAAVCKALSSLVRASDMPPEWLQALEARAHALMESAGGVASDATTPAWGFAIFVAIVQMGQTPGAALRAYIQRQPSSSSYTGSLGANFSSSAPRLASTLWVEVMWAFAVLRLTPQRWLLMEALQQTALGLASLSVEKQVQAAWAVGVLQSLDTACRAQQQQQQQQEQQQQEGGESDSLPALNKRLAGQWHGKSHQVWPERRLPQTLDKMHGQTVTLGADRTSQGQDQQDNQLSGQQQAFGQAVTSSAPGAHQVGWWWDALQAATLPRLPHLTAAQLDSLTWALACSGHKPQPCWLHHHATAAAAALHGSTEHTAVRLVWAYARLGATWAPRLTAATAIGAPALATAAAAAAGLPAAVVGGMSAGSHAEAAAGGDEHPLLVPGVLVTAVLQHTSRHMAGLMPTDLAVLVASLAAMGITQCDSSPSRSAAGGQGVRRTSQAVGSSDGGTGSGTSSGTSPDNSDGQQPSLDRRLVQRWVDSYLAAAGPLLSHMCLLNLSRVLWGLGHLGVEVSCEWGAAAARQLRLHLQRRGIAAARVGTEAQGRGVLSWQVSQKDEMRQDEGRQGEQRQGHEQQADVQMVGQGQQEQQQDKDGQQQQPQHVTHSADAAILNAIHISALLYGLAVQPNISLSRSLETSIDAVAAATCTALVLPASSSFGVAGQMLTTPSGAASLRAQVLGDLLSAAAALRASWSRRQRQQEQQQEQQQRGRSRVSPTAAAGSFLRVRTAAVATTAAMLPALLSAQPETANCEMHAHSTSSQFSTFSSSKQSSIPRTFSRGQTHLQVPQHLDRQLLHRLLPGPILFPPSFTASLRTAERQQGKAVAPEALEPQQPQQRCVVASQEFVRLAGCLAQLSCRPGHTWWAALLQALAPADTLHPAFQQPSVQQAFTASASLGHSPPRLQGAQAWELLQVVHPLLPARSYAPYAAPAAALNQQELLADLAATMSTLLAAMIEASEAPLHSSGFLSRRSCLTYDRHQGSGRPGSQASWAPAHQCLLDALGWALGAQAASEQSLASTAAAVASGGQAELVREVQDAGHGINHSSNGAAPKQSRLTNTQVLAVLRLAAATQSAAVSAAAPSASCKNAALLSPALWRWVTGRLKAASGADEEAVSCVLEVLQVLAALHVKVPQAHSRHLSAAFDTWLQPTQPANSGKRSPIPQLTPERLQLPHSFSTTACVQLLTYCDSLGLRPSQAWLCACLRRSLGGKPSASRVAIEGHGGQQGKEGPAKSQEGAVKQRVQWQLHPSSALHNLNPSESVRLAQAAVRLWATAAPTVNSGSAGRNNALLSGSSNVRSVDDEAHELVQRLCVHVIKASLPQAATSEACQLAVLLSTAPHAFRGPLDLALMDLNARLRAVAGGAASVGFREQAAMHILMQRLCLIGSTLHQVKVSPNARVWVSAQEAIVALAASICLTSPSSPPRMATTTTPTTSKSASTAHNGHASDLNAHAGSGGVTQQASASLHLPPAGFSPAAYLLQACKLLVQAAVPLTRETMDALCSVTAPTLLAACSGIWFSDGSSARATATDHESQPIPGSQPATARQGPATQVSPSRPAARPGIFATTKQQLKRPERPSNSILAAAVSPAPSDSGAASDRVAATSSDTRASGSGGSRQGEGASASGRPSGGVQARLYSFAPGAGSWADVAAAAAAHKTGVAPSSPTGLGGAMLLPMLDTPQVVTLAWVMASSRGPSPRRDFVKILTPALLAAIRLTVTCKLPSKPHATTTPSAMPLDADMQPQLQQSASAPFHTNGSSSSPLSAASLQHASAAGAPPRLVSAAAVGTRSIGTALWALGRLDAALQPRPAMELLRFSEAHFKDMGPQELSDVAFGFARIADVPAHPRRGRGAPPASTWTPGERWLAALCERLAHASVLQRLRPEHLSHLLWSLAKMGHAPPQPLMVRLLRHARLQLDAFSADGLSLLLYGLAGMGHHPPSKWMRAYLARSLQLLRSPPPRNSGGAYGARALARTAWALAALSGRQQRGQLLVPTAWLNRFIQRVRSQLPECDAQSLTQLALGLSVLGPKLSTGWMAAFVRALQRQPTALDLQVQTNMMWAWRQLRGRMEVERRTRQGTPRRRLKRVALKRRPLRFAASRAPVLRQTNS